MENLGRHLVKVYTFGGGSIKLNNSFDTMSPWAQADNHLRAVCVQ